MSQAISLYKVFLASPSDVKEEREIVKSVIENFNNVYSSKLNARLELRSWENSTYPSMGEYPQAVINHQIGNDYDIFLGILWTRFGTKTAKFESGTEEEFYNALKRYKAGEDVHIMMYFNVEGVLLNKLDPEQYLKVCSFQKNIMDLGCYYFTYSNVTTFKENLSNHFYRVIESWTTEELSKKRYSNDSFLIIDPDKKNIELGFMEYQDILATKSEEANNFLYEISEATDFVGAQIAEFTDKINILNTQNLINKMQLAKPFINGIAKVLNQYAIKIEQPIQSWGISYEQAMNACKGMLQVSDGLLTDGEWVNIKRELNNLFITTDKAYNRMTDFYSAIAHLPKLTQSIIISKKNACAKLKVFLENMNTYKSSIEEVIDLINKKIYLLD